MKKSKKFEATIAADILDVALQFAAKDPALSRDFTGLLIEPHKDGAIVVATNGIYLFAARDENGRATCAADIRLSQKCRLNIKKHRGTITPIRLEGTQIRGGLCDRPWRDVVLKKRKSNRVHMNMDANILSMPRLLARLVGMERNRNISVWSSGDISDPVVCRPAHRSDVVCLLMPMAQELAPELPRWWGQTHDTIARKRAA